MRKSHLMRSIRDNKSYNIWELPDYNTRLARTVKAAKAEPVAFEHVLCLSHAQHKVVKDLVNFHDQTTTRFDCTRDEWYELVDIINS